MNDIQTILIVEDNPDICQALCEVLSDMGFNTEKAFNGKEALDRLINHPLPQLILLDLFLPVISGTEFRKRQLEIPYLAKIPVILMSADCYVKRRCIPLRVNHWLKKPFELSDLVEAIESVGRTALHGQAFPRR